MRVISASPPQSCEELVAHGGCGAKRQQKDGPRRARPKPRSVVPQACSWDDDVFHFRRQLEHGDPPRVVVQPRGRHDIENTRHRRHTLPKADKHLELEAHPCSSVQLAGAVDVL
eukprot:4743387-Prymnesium_polylepis.1